NEIDAPARDIADANAQLDRRAADRLAIGVDIGWITWVGAPVVFTLGVFSRLSAQPPPKAFKHRAHPRPTRLGVTRAVLDDITLLITWCLKSRPENAHCGVRK